MGIDVVSPDSSVISSTQGHRGAHQPTWPAALRVRPILAMCAARERRACGRPAKRIAEPAAAWAWHRGHDMFFESGRDQVWRARAGCSPSDGPGTARLSAADETIRWSEDGCEGAEGRLRRGVSVDFFARMGTTLALAQEKGREGIGIELDERSVALTRKAVGPWPEVGRHPGATSKAARAEEGRGSAPGWHVGPRREAHGGKSP
ncbi:MAG: hypothetical protein ACRDZQ_06910 [Acidimicrobiales bacterium]